MEIVDQKLGPAEVTVNQTGGTLSVEVDLTQPISVNGNQLGSVTGKAVVQIDELAIAQLLATKYPVLQPIVDLLKAELAPASAAPTPTPATPAAT